MDRFAEVLARIVILPVVVVVGVALLPFWAVSLWLATAD